MNCGEVVDDDRMGGWGCRVMFYISMQVCRGWIRKAQEMSRLIKFLNPTLLAEGDDSRGAGELSSRAFIFYGPYNNNNLTVITSHISYCRRHYHKLFTRLLCVSPPSGIYMRRLGDSGKALLTKTQQSGEVETYQSSECGGFIDFIFRATSRVAGMGGKKVEQCVS